MKWEPTSSSEDLIDDVEFVTDVFYERGYTDGLPIIPPTSDRVESMLSGTSLRPGESVGRIPPENGEATIEKLAINAVMAGCTPEYLPIVIASVDAMLRPEFDLAGIQPTTNPLTPLVIVNGPVRHRLHLNGATGAMGPGWRANATIGRAIRLVLINIGGARPGEVDRCTQGFTGKYTLCVAENEEESPWVPLHVERGYEPADSVVTVVAVNSSTNIHDSSDDWKDVLKTMHGSLPSTGTANVIDPKATPVLALNPLHANMLHRAGFDKTRLRSDLISKTLLPPDALSKRREHLRRSEGEHFFLVNGGIPLVNDEANLLLVVLGGMQGGHSVFLSNGHYGHAISTKIDDG